MNEEQIAVAELILSNPDNMEDIVLAFTMHKTAVLIAEYLVDVSEE